MSIYFQEIKDDGYGVCVIQQKDGGLWGVSDYEYNIIVPFGKYDWIDRFDNALARVNVCSKESLIFDEENGEKDELIISVKKKWGLINWRGEEVLPVEYDNIWNFADKKRESTMVEKDGKAWDVRFKDINPEWFATTFNIQELYDSTYFPREKEDYYYEEKLITPFVNPFYNNALDMDQQSPDFWENL